MYWPCGCGRLPEGILKIILGLNSLGWLVTVGYISVVELSRSCTNTTLNDPEGVLRYIGSMSGYTV
jgi:hypothetical protein